MPKIPLVFVLLTLGVVLQASSEQPKLAGRLPSPELRVCHLSIGLRRPSHRQEKQGAAEAGKRAVIEDQFRREFIGPWTAISSHVRPKGRWIAGPQWKSSKCESRPIRRSVPFELDRFQMQLKYAGSQVPTQPAYGQVVNA